MADLLPTMKSHFDNKILPYLLLLPSFIIIGYFLFYPTIETFRLSFYRLDPFGIRRIFIGFGNFIELLTSPDYLKFWSLRIAFYGSINKHSKVLDIGCGTGRFSIALSRITGAKVYAIDPSEEMLICAMKKDKTKKVIWSKGTAENLPFPDKYFNCVYMTFVFHHIKKRKKA